MRPLLITAVVLVIAIAALLAVLYFQKAPSLTSAVGSMTVYSPAFSNGSTMPAQYTCDGADISPPLKWSGVPEKAKSLLIAMIDPDAPGGQFIHWVLYDVSPNLTELPQGVPPAASTQYGLQAVNDFGRIGYGGPCPPPGRPHRYIITVYALNATLGLPPGAPAREVLESARPYVIAEGELVGLYGR